jgi:hypothetical protein
MNVTLFSVEFFFFVGHLLKNAQKKISLENSRWWQQ